MGLQADGGVVTSCAAKREQRSPRRSGKTRSGPDPSQPLPPTYPRKADKDEAIARTEVQRASLISRDNPNSEIPPRNFFRDTKHRPEHSIATTPYAMDKPRWHRNTKFVNPIEEVAVGLVCRGGRNGSHPIGTPGGGGGRPLPRLPGVQYPVSYT